MELVHAVGENVFLHLSRNAAAGGDGFELHAQFVGQFASLGEKLERYFLNRELIYFAIYKYVVHDFNFS